MILDLKFWDTHVLLEILLPSKSYVIFTSRDSLVVYATLISYHKLYILRLYLANSIFERIEITNLLFLM